MRPIMFKEVCARLRRIPAFSVRMSRSVRQKVHGNRRQISHFPGTRGNGLLSLSGEDRNCMHANGPGSATCPDWHLDSRRAGFARDYTDRRVAVSPCGIAGLNMHACNHTKKFISNKCHFVLDAK